MNQAKPWYMSKTVWGVIISMAGKAVTAIWGLEVNEQDVMKVTDGVVMIVSLVVSFGGDILAWYGRIKATKEISSKPLG